MINEPAKKILPKHLRDDIERSIEPYLRQRADGDGVCSTQTAKDRRQYIMATVALLWQLGYRIKKLASLRPRHIAVLVKHWDETGASAEFLHNRLCVLRTMSRWIGKPNLVGDLSEYFPLERTRRKTATEEDRAWEAQSVDPLTMIDFAKSIDERLAVMLSMQYQFGLRVKESIELRPGNAVVEEGAAIEIHEGTKGGRLRRIPVETDAQRETLAWARRVAASGTSKRLRWPGRTWLQARRWFYHLLDKRLMLTKDQLGVTAHGLRHGYAHRGYEQKTGFPAPIKQAGECRGTPKPPAGLTREVHQQASMEVSRALGHGRIDVTPAYYGTYGHSLRPATT